MTFVVGLNCIRYSLPLAILLLGLARPQVAYSQNAAPVGNGNIWLAPKSTESVKPKPAEFRGGEMLNRAVPTNTWYSSVAYEKWSGVLHAHPLTFKATETGMEMGLPSAVLGSVANLKPWAKADDQISSVTFPHRSDLKISLPNSPAKDARLVNAGDWNITVEMKSASSALRTHLLHGSPFGYFEADTRRVNIELGDQVGSAGISSELLESKQVHYFSIDKRIYGLYLPSSAKLTQPNKKMLSIEFDEGANYFSVGILPDSAPKTRLAYAQSAFTFVTNTEVNWAFDREESKVRSSYTFHHKSMDGTNAPPLIGIYLHHQQKLSNKVSNAIGMLPSVRGPIQIAPLDRFDTEIRFNGLMPFWPALQETNDREVLTGYLIGDKRRAASMFGKMGNGTYWTGKALGAVAQLMNIAEQHDEQSIAQDLESLLKQKMEIWLSGKSQSYFAHDPSIGAVLGYPEEYFSVSAMNDHHFHYGYWIMAAAHLARRDPNWASTSQWGGMINLLVRDIATTQRKRVDFPFLRNFDVYEGHSWARGNSDFYGLGNDQESSSEALHAWAAIALWGQQTGQKELEDLGVYLYATETVSVLNYWFNVSGQVFHPDYKKPSASMVFGGGYGFSTWWTEEPRQIMGINFLPITPGSSYLAQLSKADVKNYLDFALAARADYDQSGQSDGTSRDIWQDIYASVFALKDPKGAIEGWNPRGSAELGDTRTRTFFWLHHLKEKGVPDLTVTANTLSYAVFRNQLNGKRTYAAYNPEPTIREVKFSDGKILKVPARSIRTASDNP